jgi:insertion element IS1 protein InsB
MNNPLPGVRQRRDGEERLRARLQATQVQGLWPELHAHHAARPQCCYAHDGAQALYVGGVDEPHGATGRGELPKRGALGAPSSGQGRGRAAKRSGRINRSRRDASLPRKKACKLWLFKAIEVLSGRLIAWTTRPRDQATAAKLFDKLKARKPCLWFTDGHLAYDVLPKAKHMVGKVHTNGIERHNARTRHCYARFHRRTLVVSRSAQMVEATLAIQAFMDHHDGRLDSLSLLA